MTQKPASRKALGCLLSILAVLAAGILGMVAGPLLMRAAEKLPQGEWNELPPPPEPLARFVANTPINYFGGEIYAETAAGTLYALVCDETCDWVKQDALPPPPDAESYWSGTCMAGYETPDPEMLKPRAPGTIVDRYETRYCGPDYFLDTFFLLLDDGTVWTWGKTDSAYGRLTATFASGFIGLIAGLIAGIVVVSIVAVTRRRAASRTDKPPAPPAPA